MSLIKLKIKPAGSAKIEGMVVEVHGYWPNLMQAQLWNWAEARSSVGLQKLIFSAFFSTLLCNVTQPIGHFIPFFVTLGRNYRW